MTGPWTKQHEQNWQQPEKVPRYAMLEPNVEKRDPAFSCEVGGQFEGRYPMPGVLGKAGEGATIHFVLKSQPKR